MLRKALTENRRTLVLAAPIVAGHVGQMLMGWADTIMIGRVGVTPLAACAFANTLLMAPFVFGFSVLSAVSVRTAMGYGGGERELAARAFRAGLLVAVAVGILVTLVIAGLLPVLPIFGQQPEVNDAAGLYLLILAVSAIPAMVSTSAKNFSEALNRPWPPFWILMGAVLLNVFLNWVLIYGNLGAPALGLEGAGWATLIARTVGAAAMLAYPLVSRRLRAWCMASRGGSTLREECWSLLALGLPVGAMHLAEVSGFALGSLMMGWISIEAMAAHQIALTCAATTFMIPLGLSQAVSVRVGQYRGGGKASECEPVVWGGLGVALLVMSACAVVLVVGGEQIARIFTDDAALISLATMLLLVAGVFQIFDGVQIVSSGALRGFEDVRFPMWIGILAYWVVALPVSYGLAFLLGLGALGVTVTCAKGELSGRLGVVNRENVLSWIAVLLLRTIFLTVRLRIDGRALAAMRAAKGSVIICFWHNRILAITLCFLRKYPPGRSGVCVLTSPSRDGELLSRIMSRLGMSSVRGSSSKRGARALRELTRLVENGVDIAITPDGPRGPRYLLGPGAIHLAQITGAPIMPVHATFSRAIRMKTWDGFNVPLPFSTISITVSPMMHVPEKLTEEEFENYRLALEKELRDAAD